MLRRLAPGIYQRPIMDFLQDETDPYTLLLSLQNLHGAAAHIGGSGALSIQGLSHYLPLGGKMPITVYIDQPSPWMKRVPVAPPIKWQKPSLINGDLGIVDLDPLQYRLFTPNPAWRLKTSGPERAIMELIEDLPNGTSFHLVDTTFQSLSNLRPRLVSSLLKSCKSVKAKRLFMIFAERHQHSWLKHIKLDEVDFGSGKRSLVAGGRLEPKYQLTLPEEYIRNETPGGAEERPAF